MKHFISAVSMLLLLCLMALPACAEGSRTYGGITLTPGNNWMEMPGEGDYDQFVCLDNVAVAAVNHNDLSGVAAEMGDAALDPAIMKLFIESTICKRTGADHVEWMDRDDGIACAMAAFEMNGVPAVMAMAGSGPDLVTMLFYLPAQNEADLSATAMDFMRQLRPAGATVEDKPDAVTSPETAEPEAVTSPETAEAGDAPGTAADGIRIPEVPMTVHLSEDDCNLFTQDNDPNSPSMQRCPYGADKMNLYTRGLGISLMVTHKDENPMAFNIQIRVKDDKYTGRPDWSMLDDAGIQNAMRMLYNLDPAVENHEVYRTPGFAWSRFALGFDRNALRYATIQNGDMIYVHAMRDDGPLTDEDLALLEAVVNAIELG